MNFASFVARIEPMRCIRVRNQGLLGWWLLVMMNAPVFGKAFGVWRKIRKPSSNDRIGHPLKKIVFVPVGSSLWAPD
ncbi:uncharacterized protein BYT42DRAFT_553711 [Radiomyces spectabilis]|uniref:uncharacterized protein n=1 Tax=Radiomyces spectabilis TaxID=64574 RepID=UPI0022202490|nr:uncharacterized protein BYT42DRAFT_553711 [Radiomyces spectabilis]KAI8394210.1 hypothetical protein BYT42DRAFT_553711 [Radiomyces spectabilis]